MFHFGCDFLKHCHRGEGVSPMGVLFWKFCKASYDLSFWVVVCETPPSVLFWRVVLQDPRTVLFGDGFMKHPMSV